MDAPRDLIFGQPERLGRLDGTAEGLEVWERAQRYELCMQ